MKPSSEFLYFLENMVANVDAAETLDEAKQILALHVREYLDLMINSISGE